MDKGHEDCIATNWLARYNMAIYRFGAASDKYTGTQFFFTEKKVECGAASDKYTGTQFTCSQTDKYNACGVSDKTHSEHLLDDRIALSCQAHSLLALIVQKYKY